MAKKKSGGNRKSSSSKKPANRANTSGAGNSSSRSRGRNKSSRSHTRKYTSRRNPGGFGELTRAVKSTLVGTGGAFVSKVGGDIGISVVGRFAPSVADFKLASPLAVLLVAWFGTPRLVRAVGGSPASAETARVGGLIAAGLEGFDVMFPDVREGITSKARNLIGDGRARGIDRRAVQTNAQTAVMPSTAVQQIAQGAAAGAAQAVAANPNVNASQAAAEGAAQGVANTLSGLGYISEDTSVSLEYGSGGDGLNGLNGLNDDYDEDYS